MASNVQAIIGLAGLALLAGCGSSDSPQDTTDAAVAPEAMPRLAESKLQPPVAQDSSAAQGMPASLQGRWAIAPADCSKAPGPGTTTMVVGADGLQLPEANGRIAAIAERSDTRIHARLNLTDSARSFSRDIMLELQPGGSTLIRNDYGENVEAAPRSYTRCPA